MRPEFLEVHHDAFVEDYKLVLFDYVGCVQSDLGEYDALKYASLDEYAQNTIDICGDLDLKGL